MGSTASAEPMQSLQSGTGPVNVVFEDDFLMGLAHPIRLAYRLLIWFVPALLLELSWVAQCLFNALFE